jgi:hypothetical protein
VEICARVYRPRRARESPLFRLVEQHLEELLRVYPARFARAHGQQAVLYRSRLNPSLGRNFEALEPVLPGPAAGNSVWTEFADLDGPRTPS